MHKIKTQSQWLVHDWEQAPKLSTRANAKKLLKKHGGSYQWLDNTCHVYLKPVCKVSLRAAGLNPK